MDSLTPTHLSRTLITTGSLLSGFTSQVSVLTFYSKHSAIFLLENLTMSNDFTINVVHFFGIG